MANVYSVGQINAYIKEMFAQDFLLRRVSVKGEVSNCKYHSSGHIYFTLKDETGTIACVMFRGDRGGLPFEMKEGQKVVADGSISVYERDGKYQLYAKQIRLEGSGDLYQKFLALKTTLEEQGMFAPEYKQPIPHYVRTLGVVTAPTGAAVQDIINVATRRNPYVQIILYPAIVQGEQAAPSIVAGIHALEALPVDAMIVGRGGGSIEDLWAFNEEMVAQAIFDCPIPIISAVGHETDFTIADFVADLRAPTPSAAAELAVCDVQELLAQMQNYRNRISQLFTNRFRQYTGRLAQYKVTLNALSPASQIREKRTRLMHTEDALQENMKRILTAKRHALALYAEQLKGLSPLEKLQQGYAYTADEKGRTVSSVDRVSPGDMLLVYVRDGKISAAVQNTEKINWEA